MKVLIPIRGSDFEKDYPSYESFLKEIIALSENKELIILLDDILVPKLNERPRISNLSFEIISGNRHENTEPKFATELNKKHSFFHTEWISEYLILNIKLTDEISEEYDCVNFTVNRILKRLNFLINLSYSTNVDFLYGVIYSESNKYVGKTKIIASTNMYAYEHSRKMNWPKIKNLSLKDTVSWFHKFKIHTDSLSKNDLHRAMNAFSNLFGDIKQKSSGDLFWIMLGIESLLVSGNQNITSQFKEKSILILGKPKEYGRKLSKLYEYRSKLVHGSYDIFPSHFEGFDELERKYSDYLDFAVSILIALIRELIEKQKCYFEFELILKE